MDPTSAMPDKGSDASNAPAAIQQVAASGLAQSGQHAQLDASKLTYAYTKTPRTVPVPNSAEVWGQGTPSDHMITCKWTVKAGWETPHLVPYGPLHIMPTASALHYSTECFEGMKVFRGHDGRMRLFRPDKNANRMLTSALRVSLPGFAPDQLQVLIKKLAEVDGPKWLPRERPGTYLYVRPTLIGTAESLAVKKPDEALLFILLVPFPPYDEPGGTLGPAGASKGPPRRAGVRLYASEEDTVRAWPGGFGYAKLGANYGPSLIASAQAAAKGYDQILWLFGKEELVTEAGSSNFFAVVKDKDSGREQLITAPLEGQLVLPGVTRISVLEIAREKLSNEIDIVEKQFTIHDLLAAHKEGRLLEAFASGTAFFIAAIGVIHYKGQDYEIPLSEGVMGKRAQQIRTLLRGIQYGEEAHPWGHVVEDKGFDVQDKPTDVPVLAS